AARRILDRVGVTVLRGNPGEVATLVGAHAEVRGVESMTAGMEAAELARAAARRVRAVASVTGPVDHVSDGERVLAVSNGHDLLSWRDLGFRAAAVNLSDLAASGAEPLALIVSLGIPGEARLGDVLELYEGLNEPGVPVRGGDTTRAGSVLLTVTALGRSERV